MNALVAPIVVPALTAAVLLILPPRRVRLVRVVSAITILTLVGISGWFLGAAGDVPQVCAIGGWPAPHGIVLALDRVSALMLALTAVLAALSFPAAIARWDGRGSVTRFHVLLQLELMGLNGVFLAGDVFNLFVFFELLLIASIGLLVHGGGASLAAAGFRYAVLNLLGSSFLLLGVALLYGVTGTLNMADLSARVAALDPARFRIAEIAAALLLTAFAVKAAIFPLYQWLPRSYAATGAPIAAFFAIMTKVGIYAVLRIFVLVFGEAPPVASEGILWAGLFTVAFGSFGVLASRDLGRFASYLAVVSTGTMLAAIGLFSPDGTSAALFYMVQSTFMLAGFFLLRELLAFERHDAADRFVPGPDLRRNVLLPLMFWILTAAAVGLPPFAGFIGKLLVLESAIGTPDKTFAVWIAVLVASLVLLAAAARAGLQIFWATTRNGAVAREGGPEPWSAALVVVMQVVLIVVAQPLREFTDAAARQLHEISGYRAAILATGRTPGAAGHDLAGGRE
jgi:multicomponent K+:H+ antiporter subunit D